MCGRFAASKWEADVDDVRWGMIGCGEVTEIKSGPGFQKAEGAALVAVMSRDRAKAEDYARRHGVPRVHADADALIQDPEVDAVYIATPPSSHCELALKVAAAGKPCLVEKPMGLDYAECVRMVDAFSRAARPLWVAYYRRALPRFLKVRELLRDGAIGRVTSVHMEVTQPLVSPEQRSGPWRFNPEIAGAGLFLDLSCHCFDLLDFLLGPISAASGSALNTGDRYPAEDVTAAAFQFGANAVGTGIWNFNADRDRDELIITGSAGHLRTSVFGFDDELVVTHGSSRNAFRFRKPDHVHQGLIQTIVDELHGRGVCESTGESGARTNWVMDRCLESYYKSGKEEGRGKKV
jgi:1,5-anhydro-D-fructose reductase (1,5-anhydro-D-mannitol-forming)